MSNKRPPVNQKPLCFIDTETTGLDPVKHEVIEFAIIREHQGRITDRWCTKIKPVQIETAEEIALEINGYTPEKWEDAPTMAEVGPTIYKLLKGSVIVGHNVPFDEAMLNSSLRRAGFDERIPYHKVDTTTLVYEHLASYGITSLSMDNVRRFLGWSLEDAHTAMKDADDARRLFKLLVNPRRRDKIRWWLRSLAQ